MVDKKEAYDADSLQKYDPIDHIRKRISMYLGDNTGEGGMSTALREILDNSQDEFLNGHGNKIVLTFFPDGSAEVQDSGRGIPTGINKDTGENGIVLSLAHVGAGGKFGTDDSGYAGGSGGLNGVGTTASNAISKRFDVTVYRDNKESTMSFREGKPGFFDKPNDPTAKFKETRTLKTTTDPRTAKDKKARPTGTTIRMWPDSDIFIPGAKFDVETIKFRLRSTAFLLPGLTIEINDLTNPDEPVYDVYSFDGGIAEMLGTLTNEKQLHKPIHITTESSFTEKASVQDKEGKISFAEVTRKVDVDVAFVYVDGYENITKSFVNIINTKHGGKHEEGFYRGLSKSLIDGIKSTRGLIKAKELPPNLDDVKEGLVAIISVKFLEPQFVGQEKGSLGTTAISPLVSRVVTKNLNDFLTNKKNLAVMKTIYAKVVESARIRVSSRQQKDLARKKSALETSSSMPDKLVECSTPDSEYSELLIVEGDSALGTMRAARDSRFQALLPIRGKILNVQKTSTTQMLENSECAAIIQCLGAGSGKSFDMTQARYGKIIIAADADVDGAHIRTLLITFFWKYMRPYVEAGRIYSLMPPLYAIKTHGKNSEVFYAIDEKERDQIMKKLDTKKVRYEIGRNKGLGEMDAEPTWDTLLDPENRKLKQITVDDIEASIDMLEIAMGTAVPPRRAWIESSRDKINEIEGIGK